MKDIFKLIKSLKPTEKRYFTLSSGIMTPAKKSNYLKLFNAIDSMPDDDEDAFAKKFRRESFMTNLAVNKNHLYEILLESLRNYNEENIEEWAIRKQFYKIEILANKGLDKNCESLIKKTKDKAWQYEQYQLLQDIIELELYLFGNCRIGNFQKDFFIGVQLEKDKLVKIISDYNFILSTWHKLNLTFINEMHQPFSQLKEEGQALIENLLSVEVPSEELSLRTRNRYFACFELYYNSIGNAERCYHYNHMLLENRKLIDAKMPNFTPDAMAVYFNFMVACFKFEKWEEMEIYLQKTKEFPITFLQQEIRRAHNYCYCGILLYLSTKKYDEADKLVEHFLIAKEKYSGSYRLDFMLFTMCHCGWYYFVTKQFDKANALWREISQGPKYSVEVRSQATTKCYLIIYYYTLGEFDLMQSEIKSGKRYLKQNYLLNANESNFLTAMSKLVGNKNDIIVFSNLFQTIKGSDQILTEKSIINRFIVEWVGSKN